MPLALEEGISMSLAQHQRVAFLTEAGQPFLAFSGEGAGLVTLQQHIVERDLVLIHSALSNLPQGFIRQVRHGLEFRPERWWEITLYGRRQAASEGLDHHFIHRAIRGLCLSLQFLIKVVGYIHFNGAHRHIHFLRET